MTAARNVPGYSAAHKRVARKRGPASRHQCRCGARQAVDWAYIGTGPFGPPEKYVPLCRPCHTVQDEGRGENHPNSRLTVTDVHAIRARAADGEPQRAIATAYGISQATAWAVIRRVTWQHIT